ncbi:hypothetical protein [Flavobacterium sp. AED]|uniref:hypothetical protein n=1 Tax=Flavobacterium TaxID=237 RepID=UPI00057FF01A|nr:hypothetical protein [Flavobacterium sp. AED]KIA85561.1 hypothetical protein OA85_09735 [Flavobacterium sp. AED]MDI1306862.1 hypothetical protein [bacterium]
MKIVPSLFVTAFMLLSINTISAQYGNSGYGGGGYGRNGYGSGRMNSGMDQNRTPDKPREVPVEETVGKIMERLKPALVLDELQEIAIANILTESIKQQGVILKQDTNQSDQMKDIQILSENTERKVVELLNDDQKEKYKVFKEESKNPKKSKRNR